ncbi:MAG: hypothetical protein HY234_07485 [Acidobacteria bacterium]|nr:hypothetical protein [Acidobacteriota bacterium]MBI3662875.1 hypothetical protein [Acidobacteriota bacterium]
MTEQDTLKKLWAALLPTVAMPSDRQFFFWLQGYSAEVVRHGILRAAKKNLRMNSRMCPEHALRYAACCMSSFSARQNATLERLVEKTISECEGQTP